MGSNPVWDSFISKYPSGFYTDLAKAHRDKLDAEAARVEATNKARAAQEQQTRLAIEGAKAAEQAKAAERARIAEQARVAAELTKKAEEAKVADAERTKTVGLAKAAEDAKAAVDNKANDDGAAVSVAALAPPEQTTETAARPDQPVLADLSRLLQAELRRVGCNTGSVDGNWNAAAQKSLDLFNKNAGMKLDVKVASLDALDAVKAKSA